jgi:hypothetical protein
MALSMAIRSVLAALLLFALAGCGGEQEADREVRLLAPAGLVGDTGAFERRTGCRVDLRVYDEGEDLDAIARRRNADVVAGPVPPGAPADDAIELVTVEVASGLEVTIPRAMASAFEGAARPAGRRRTRWMIREDGEDEVCAERWLDYARSQ